MNIKKQRGQKRKLKILLDNINQIVPFMNQSLQYENFYVPCDQFISSSKTSGKIKTAFCKAWIEKAERIIEEKPKELSFCKVIAVIDTKELWKSQIIIFYDKEYYDSFWNRNTEDQAWSPIDSQNLSFINERNIVTKLSEKGYIETIREDGFSREFKLWFYGDINNT